MPFTDQDVLSEVQAALLEPRDGGSTFPSALWTPAEILGYLNDGLRDVLLATGAVMVHDTSIIVSAGVTRYDLPVNLLSIYSLAFVGIDGKGYALSRADSFQADHLSGVWPTTSGTPRPVSYTVGELPSQAVELYPAPNIPGYLDIIATLRPMALTGEGDAVPMPDELVAVLKWYTLAAALGKLGRTASPARAAYGTYRVREIQTAAKLALAGWA